MYMSKVPSPFSGLPRILIRTIESFSAISASAIYPWCIVVPINHKFMELSYTSYHAPLYIMSAFGYVSYAVVLKLYLVVTSNTSTTLPAPGAGISCTGFVLRASNSAEEIDILSCCILLEDAPASAQTNCPAPSVWRNCPAVPVAAGNEYDTHGKLNHILLIHTFICVMVSKSV